MTVTDDPAELRYEARRGDTMLGQIRYRTEPGLVVLVHTDVATSARAAASAPRSFRCARRHPLARVTRRTVCPFVAAYIRRHPEYADLVAPDPATPD